MDEVFMKSLSFVLLSVPFSAVPGFPTPFLLTLLIHSLTHMLNALDVYLLSYPRPPLRRWDAILML